MRILNWVQNKLSAKQEKKRFDPVPSSSFYDRKEEFSDWPQALLAIGTFGNNEFKENQKRHCSSEDDSEDKDPQTLSFSGNSEPFHDLPDFTLEEVSQLQNELAKLLALKPKTSIDFGIEGERPNFPLNRYLNCPSSLEVDRIACQKICDDIQDKEGGDLSPKSTVMLSKVKDILTDNPVDIRRRSISFLLKKMFTCRRGRPPVPNIRDSVPESMTDKLLRMILHKKIYPQSSTPTLVRKYLEKKPWEKRREGKGEGKDGKLQEKEEEGCKWVKTDSEFIVLEMQRTQRPSVR